MLLASADGSRPAEGSKPPMGTSRITADHLRAVQMVRQIRCLYFRAVACAPKDLFFTQDRQLPR